MVVVCVLFIVFLYKLRGLASQKNKKWYIAIHTSNTIGAACGFAAIVITVSGVTQIHCFLAALFMVLNLVICEGTRNSFIFLLLKFQIKVYYVCTQLENMWIRTKLLPNMKFFPQDQLKSLFTVFGEFLLVPIR
jgi:hypothetical protein